MRITEILLEYRRDITANNIGRGLIYSLRKDTGNIPTSVEQHRQQLRSMNDQRIDSAIKNPETQQAMTDLANKILAQIEAADPTKNKQYTERLARMYAGGNLKLEDINRHELLSLYHIAKQRGLIKGDDFNRYKSYNEFENAMTEKYAEIIRKAQEPQQQVDKGEAEEVYNDNNVRIIVPEDETAACYYGQGTRWCTASKNNNYFEGYNDDGPLYIMLPKKPKYPGEKYQLHFASNQFMDENDDSIPIYELLTDRFPETLKFFKKNVPDIENQVVFISDKELEHLFEQLRYYFIPKGIEAYHELKNNGTLNKSSYRDWFAEYNLLDNNGEIDWDKADKEIMNQFKNSVAYASNVDYLKSHILDKDHIDEWGNSSDHDLIENLEYYFLDQLGPPHYDDVDGEPEENRKNDVQYAIAHKLNKISDNLNLQKVNDRWTFVGPQNSNIKEHRNKKRIHR